MAGVWQVCGRWPWQVAVAAWPWQVAVAGGRGRWPWQRGRWARPATATCHAATATCHLPRPPATCHGHLLRPPATAHLPRPPATAACHGRLPRVPWPPATANCHGHRPPATATCHNHGHLSRATSCHVPPPVTCHLLSRATSCHVATCQLPRPPARSLAPRLAATWFHFWSFPNLFWQSGLAQLGYFLGAHFGNEATWKRVILEPTFHPKIIIRLVRSSWHWLPALKI